MKMSDIEKICWSGKFLRIITRGRWEIAQRHNCNGIVGIIAVTNDQELILVEQYRIPVRANVIEIPAGLSGDSDEHHEEPLRNAAERELLEETGYTAKIWQYITDTASSAGLTDEIISFYLAKNLTKITDGGGDSSESITVHRVKIKDLPNWLTKQQSDGKIIDAKVFASLHWINQLCP
ncbi:NUDIX hydrolase [Planctomycetota bacterium]|nr:NUDIX hydrolase [Planctomycetota bacterium]